MLFPQTAIVGLLVLGNYKYRMLDTFPEDNQRADGQV